MYLPNVNTNIEALVAVTKQLEVELDSWKQKADETIGKPVKLKEYPKSSDYCFYKKFSISGYASGWFQQENIWGERKEITTKAELDKRLVKITEMCKKYDEDADLVEEENKPLIAHNQALVDKIKKIMEHVGIPLQYSVKELPTPRSRTPKMVTKSAGFLGDLERNIPTQIYGRFDTKRSLADAKRVHQTLVDKIATEERKKAIEKAKKEGEMKLAYYRVKYTPNNPLSGMRDVFDGILDKCKYLRLAHYMQLNRGDWTEGYSYAEQGLNGFTTETPEDQEIYDNIYNICQYEDVDGRYFRDCEYSYNVLFEKVDEELYADYIAVSELINLDY